MRPIAKRTAKEKYVATHVDHGHGQDRPGRSFHQFIETLSRRQAPPGHGGAFEATPARNQEFTDQDRRGQAAARALHGPVHGAQEAIRAGDAEACPPRTTDTDTEEGGIP